jgi:hypothetical protein
MSYKSCKGYTEYRAKCDTCEFDERTSSITLRNTHRKFKFIDGQDCPDDCKGMLSVTEREVSEHEHKEGYLNHHADDEVK